jgi:hypothetical protein
LVPPLGCGCAGGRRSNDYNDVRLHSAIGYLTPTDRLAGRHLDIFAERDRKLVEARERRKLIRQAEHERRCARECQPSVTDRPAIDFAAVRAAVNMTAVLGLLGFRALSVHGAQQRGPCPLHGSTAGAARCSSVNTSDQIFHCFKCGRSGNALDLWAHAKPRPNSRWLVGPGLGCGLMHAIEACQPRPRPRNSCDSATWYMVRCRVSRRASPRTGRGANSYAARFPARHLAARRAAGASWGRASASLGTKKDNSKA